MRRKRRTGRPAPVQADRGFSERQRADDHDDGDDERDDGDKGEMTVSHQLAQHHACSTAKDDGSFSQTRSIVPTPYLIRAVQSRTHSTPPILTSLPRLTDQHEIRQVEGKVIFCLLDQRRPVLLGSKSDVELG